MKLISCTEFIIDQFELLYKAKIHEHEYITRTKKYSTFLKQPLKLEMFVPCDDEGNVLDKPQIDNENFSTLKPFERNEYQQAKEKVLFEGCSISKLMPDNYYQVYCDSDRILWLSWNKSKTIEDLILSNLTLTESAKKQIGI